MNTILQCVTADDEPLALKLVETFIEQTPFLRLAGSCSSAVEVIKLLQNIQADLLLLDINMPNLNGMELAHLLQQQPPPLPKIIFTTAYNHYAIEGYKVNAVDYLLKPFNYEEFLRAVNKALQLTQAETKPAARAEEESLFIKVEYLWVKVAYKDILYIESLKDYVKLHLAAPAKSVLSLTSLKVLEERLPAAKFVRMHRSYIVALDKITSISKTALHIGDTEIPVGEQYRKTFKAIVDKWIL